MPETFGGIRSNSKMLVNKAWKCLITLIENDSMPKQFIFSTFYLIDQMKIRDDLIKNSSLHL